MEKVENNIVEMVNWEKKTKHSFSIDSLQKYTSMGKLLDEDKAGLDFSFKKLVKSSDLSDEILFYQTKRFLIDGQLTNFLKFMKVEGSLKYYQGNIDELVMQRIEISKHIDGLEGQYVQEHPKQVLY